MLEERTRTRRAPEGRITGRAPEAHALHLGLDVHIEGQFLRFSSRLPCTGTAASFEKKITVHLESCSPSNLYRDLGQVERLVGSHVQSVRSFVHSAKAGTRNTMYQRFPQSPSVCTHRRVPRITMAWWQNRMTASTFFADRMSYWCRRNHEGPLEL